MTPLHSAAASGTAETVNALLDGGANPKARTTGDDKLPADLAEDHPDVRNSDAYWKLNEARFD